jgi:hypothetical protein
VKWFDANILDGTDVSLRGPTAELQKAAAAKCLLLRVQQRTSEETQGQVEGERVAAIQKAE